MATRMEELKEQEKNIRILQDNAMKMRSANQFGRLNRMLEEVWREIDSERRFENTQRRN